jgi:hypothetical protein
MVYSNAAITQKLEDLNSGLLKGHAIFNSDAFYDSRFKKQESFAHNINYMMTESRDLIEQYLGIREEIYREAYNDSNVGEDFTDQVSTIFVASAGYGNVVGGIRLTVSTPRVPNILPLEHAGVNLRQIFPSIDFDSVVYGEASRLAVLPDYRDGAVSDNLQLRSKEYFVKEMGAEIGFGYSTLAHTKKFKKFFSRMGYSFITRTDISIKVASSDAELYLWAIDFTPDKRHAEALEMPLSEQENTDNTIAVADIHLEIA